MTTATAKRNKHKPKYTRESLRRLAVFTTGQIALLCRVAPRTVSYRWIDGGKLKGYRLPGSMDRRVYRADLIRFARDNGLTEVADFLAPSARIVLIGCADAAVEGVRAAHPDLAVIDAANDYSVGRELAAGCTLAVIDLSIGRRAVVSALAECERLKPAPEIVLLSYRETTADELAATAGFEVVGEPWCELGDVVGKAVMG